MAAEGSDNAPEAGAPHDVEITPAMIEAGAVVVSEFFDEVIAYDSEIARLAAIAVYQAMDRARRENSPS
jgi:hypothetical protein